MPEIELEKRNISIRNIDKKVWDKAIHYRRLYGYETVANFLEEAIESYCLILDNTLRKIKENGG